MKRYFILSLLVAFAFFTNAQTHEEGRLVGTHWSFNPNMEHNVTFSGIVFLDGESMQNRPRTADLEIGAFCGEECRGSALPMYFDVPIFQGYLYMMQIYSNNADGEQITFRVYDHALGEELNVTSQTTLDFVANAEYGNILDPFVIEFLSMPVVTTSVNLAEGGTVSGGGAYVEGATCTLTATPSPGYIFVNWTENAEVVSTEATYTFTVTGDRELVANFIRSYTITATTEPAEGGMVSLYATIILTAGDVWGDGTGYQMLLDADATAYGNEIPTDGPFDASNYDAFEYKIPENADCNVSTGNIVFNNSVSITIPSGTYDWCITNPEPSSSTMWIASSNGNIGGRQDDYVFEAGKTYEFVASGYGFGDGIDVTISPAVGVYAYGQACTLTATPNTNYIFDNWTENGEVVSTENPYTFTVTSDRDLVANFMLENPFIPTEDLVAYYPFDGDVNDYSGNGNHGTIIGNVVPATDRHGNPNGAYRFPGEAFNYISVPDAEILHMNAFTLSAWVYNDADNYGSGYLINKGRDINNGSYHLNVRSVGATTQYGGTNDAGIDENPELCQWHMITGTVEGNQARFYVDGVLQSEVTLSNPFSYGNSDPLTLGCHYYNGVPSYWAYTLLGVMDEVRIYSRVLTPQEVMQLYTIDNGCLPGAFSVAEGSYVNFSKGNLQYKASTDTWRFAENQWDCVGPDNANISETYDGWIDLFGWGTSGYNHGANAYQPWSTSQNNSDYWAYGDSGASLSDYTGQADWGYNAISNGGNQEGLWHTLSHSEWDYLINNRPASTLNGVENARHAKAVVNGIAGLILFPDHYSHPDSIAVPVNINEYASQFTDNEYTIEQWYEMEDAGAVFLPTAGIRSGGVPSIGSLGIYWSTTPSGSSFSHRFDFTTDYVVAWGIDSKWYGYSVRLVKSVLTTTCSIEAVPNPAEGGTVTGAGTYFVGETCTLTAIPNESYTFINWTENGEVVSTEATYSFTVTTERNLVANFALPFTITASVLPEEGGTVTGAGEYDYGAECTLVATPNEDYSFVKWTKGETVVSTQSSYSFVVTEDADFVAHFTLKMVGTVMAEYDPNPDDNQSPYVRVSWSMDSNLQEDFESGDFNMHPWEFTDSYPWVITGYNPYEGTFCMRSNNGGAHYTSSTVQTTMFIPSEGQMSFYSKISSESRYDYGRFYIDGQEMGNWSGNGGWEQHIYDITVGQHTFTWAYTKDGSVNSGEDCFYVDNINFFGADRSGNRSVHHYEVYRSEHPENGSWELLADNVTDTSYVDTGWSALAEGWYKYGVVAYYEGYDTVYPTYMARSNRILRAYPHSITATANPEEGGNIIGAGDYVLYTECVLTATANENYTFINWTENGEVVSTDPTYSFTVTTDRDLVANFHLPFTVTATANPEEGGTIIGAGEYDYGTQCTLTATANENFVFISWTENGEWVTSDASFSFTVMGEKEYVAVFHPILDSISDDFNDGVIDAAQWTYRGSTVYENDGLMKIEQNVTDDDVRLTTFPMSLTPTGQIVMERRFMVHRASDYFSGGFAINLNGIGDEQSYIRVSYWHENYVNKHGTYIDALIDGQTTETFLCNAVFDTWMVEKIIVDTETGAFLYCINNEVVATTTIAGLASKDVSYYTIKFWPFSWWTGHYQYMDYVNINMDLGATYTVNASASPIEGGEVVGGGMFDLGQTCSLVATPNENYTFMYWTENDNVISAAPEYSFLVGVDRNLEAHFALPFHITASSNPEDGGVIIGAGVYDYGTECTLTATANENYTFINWTENGEVVTSQPSFGFTVTEDRNFVANFTLPFNITASANPEEGGSIIGTGVYDYGTECSLTAIANEGYTFVYWSENGSLFSTEESIAFTAIEDRNFVANFVEGNTCAITFNLHDSYGDGWNGNRLVVTTDYGITHEVTLSSGSSGTQTLMLVDGHHVTLSWISGNWINECSFTVSYSNGNVIYPGTNLSGTSFGFDMDCERMPATMYDITVVAEPVEGGAVTGAGEYLVNTECQLTEAVNEGYTFINWTMNGNVVSTNPTYSFTVTDAANYVAHFELNSYNITIGANPTMGGTMTGEGTYNHFSTCTLTASPKLGYSFVNWTKDGNEVSTEETYSFMVTGGGEYVANFEIVDITQTVNLPHGWSWWSTYIETENNNALEQLETGMAENGVMIKSHDNGFLTYDIGLWMGNLNSINNESMYLINTSADTEFGLTGRYAALTTHIITLNPSWSWIGYPLGTATDVSRALANLDAMDGDMVKTSHSFAEYEDGYGWVGSLQTFYPGMGLMYYSSNNQEVSLIYAEGTRGGELKENITADGNHFMPTSNAHPFNMSMTAIVELEGNELHGGSYEIAAFAEDECRGSVRMMDVEALNRYMAFLTVVGDEATMLNFRLFDVERGITYYSDQHIAYETDAIVGTLKVPAVLRFNSSSADCAETLWSCEVYPNPVMTGEWVKINWGPIPTSEAKVEIVNALGAVVGVETVNSQPAFVKAPNVPGVYMLRITSEGKGSQIYKLIVK